MTVDHLVIGGGVVGLAVGHYLTQQFPRKSTYLVERSVDFLPFAIAVAGAIVVVVVLFAISCP